ncbi:unnamed protein product [Brachionus calyciflorus]|uniref:Uncharacterized protein n=1 Tax=Brachionus calyciflorus TaxID=104777 RepID=A0A814DH42_9BILA|nr:unnamed protein product [Brachionus calyciflorus]
MEANNCLNCSELTRTHDLLMRKIQTLTNDKTKLQSHLIRTDNLIDEIKQEQEESVRKFSTYLDSVSNEALLSPTELIRSMSEHIRTLYRCSFVSDVEARFSSNVSNKIGDIIEKINKAENEKPLKLNNSLIFELNEYKNKTLNLKLKLDEQTKQIQKLLYAKKIESNSTPFTSVTDTSSNNTTVGSSSNTSGLGENLCVNQDDLYTCPLCLISIESCKITQKKFESHVKKCDPSKISCMFCFKLYEKSELVLFENHVQKHILKENLTKSPTTQVSISKRLNLEKRESNSGDLSSNKSASSGNSSGNSSFLLNDAALDVTEDTHNYVNYSAVRQYLKLNDTEN